MGHAQLCCVSSSIAELYPTVSKRVLSELSPLPWLCSRKIREQARSGLITALKSQTDCPDQLSFFDPVIAHSILATEEDGVSTGIDNFLDQ